MHGDWLRRCGLRELNSLFGMRVPEAAQDRCNEQGGTDQNIHLLKEQSERKTVFLTVTAQRCNAVREP